MTTDASDTVRPLHDRMPAIIEPEDYAAWLDPQRRDPEELEGLLHSEVTLVSYPVNPVVNSAQVDTPRCIEPYREVERERRLF